MDAFISLELDVKELKDYKEIKKISEICNAILQNGVEHLYEEKKLELTYENQKHDLQPEKSKRKLSLRTVEFFDEKTKKKRIVSVYSPYVELKDYGLVFENKGKSVYKYAINLVTERQFIFGKETFFRQKKNT